MDRHPVLHVSCPFELRLVGPFSGAVSMTITLHFFHCFSLSIFLWLFAGAGMKTYTRPVQLQTDSSLYPRRWSSILRDLLIYSRTLASSQTPPLSLARTKACMAEFIKNNQTQLHWGHLMLVQLLKLSLLLIRVSRRRLRKVRRWQYWIINRPAEAERWGP